MAICRTGLTSGRLVAIDTETLGLNPFRDRLCLAQLSAGDGVCHAVQFAAGEYAAPNLRRLLERSAGDQAVPLSPASTWPCSGAIWASSRAPVYCTKIASKLVRTYTDRHGLKDLVRELLGVDISKEQQSSDWGAAKLTEKQLAYAASDVAHLHRLKSGARPRCWRARAARNWPRPASTSCPPAPSSTWPAGRTSISSPIEAAGRAGSATRSRRRLERAARMPNFGMARISLRTGISQLRQAQRSWRGLSVAVSIRKRSKAYTVRRPNPARKAWPTDAAAGVRSRSRRRPGLRLCRRGDSESWPRRWTAISSGRSTPSWRAKGRVIVERHGQVRPDRAQDRRHPGLHRHARPFHPSGRGQPWRSGRGHAATTRC